MSADGSTQEPTPIYSEEEVVGSAIATTFAIEMADGMQRAVRACVESGMSTQDAVHAVLIGSQAAIAALIQKAWQKDDDVHRMAHDLLDLCWEMKVPDSPPQGD